MGHPNLSSTAYQGDPVEFERKRPYPPEVVSAVVSALTAYLPEDATVADIGAGTGRWAVPLARQGYRVLALDLSPRMLNRLQANLLARPASSTAEQPHPLPRVVPILADAHALPLPAGSCQAVMTVHTLHLMQDLPRAVAEAVRVLHPGGRLFLGYVEHLPGSVVGWAMATWRAMLREAGYDLNRPAWRDQQDVLLVLRRFLEPEGRLTPAQWTPTVDPAQVVAGALQRAYTLYWGLDDATHRRFGERLLRQAQAVFAPFHQPRPDPRRFVWEVFRKPA